MLRYFDQNINRIIPFQVGREGTAQDMDVKTPPQHFPSSAALISWSFGKEVHQYALFHGQSIIIGKIRLGFVCFTSSAQVLSGLVLYLTAPKTEMVKKNVFLITL